MRPFSLIVITRDAEAHLERCLKSVPFAAEAVVLDSGSTDRTVEIARANGARVFIEDWRGFGPQRNRATELAQHDWVLHLDADEALSEESAAELRQVLAQPEISEEAFAFPRLSHHLGRWIQHGGWYPDWQVRLYNRKLTSWTPVQLHEKIQSTRVGRLKKPLRHWVFSSLTDQVATNNRYSGLGADELASRGQSFVLFNLLVKPKVKFFETYIWKRGFLDGLPGFIIAVGAAYSVFLKWAKLWERQQRVEKSN